MENPFTSSEYLKHTRKGYTAALEEITKDMAIGDCAPVYIEGLTYHSAKALLAKKKFHGQFITTQTKKTENNEDRVTWIKRISLPKGEI